MRPYLWPRLVQHLAQRLFLYGRAFSGNHTFSYGFAECGRSRAQPALALTGKGYLTDKADKIQTPENIVTVSRVLMAIIDDILYVI